mmetsp:Transcript_62679/g.130044  ORF Transcript_62679/g.130044 Transcript_62679/m.130044 type:complete len:144 (+) Transcript_62679:65-496(+)
MSLVDLLKKQTLQDDEMLSLNALLMQAVGEGNYGFYELACDKKLSCFEPEAKGHLVTGLNFHKYYFDLKEQMTKEETASKLTTQSTMSSPSITWLCQRQAAIVCFKRLVQSGTNTVATEETRVWEFSSDLKQWKMMHFHRSSG